jgi:hypothetical protein
MIPFQSLQHIKFYIKKMALYSMVNHLAFRRRGLCFFLFRAKTYFYAKQNSDYNPVLYWKSAFFRNFIKMIPFENNRSRLFFFILQVTFFL